MSPLWLNYTSLWPFMKLLLSVWQNVELILANISCNLANFHCCKWPNIKQIMQLSGHTAGNDGPFEKRIAN